ncbi:CubicO group peptidase, beta-lactamase class C family [Amycolatopsis xylanica]|uniref:CubicO group peptidase, beta-lactamase class C family n=1 Tax=Amycolatopsis xylanica TaxID=589385 RepID=A0A1H2USZ9_9PSEU|nr:serine hydrolase domain-containing protein [Amycolatopsis xylanica]SDW59180.1 CubicO group peptidase, beta-lactamase class C family [Amycolatopsis xylanica]
MDTETFTGLLAKHGVPGAQLVVRRGDETLSLAAGEERLGSGRAVTAESRFPLGSLTKPFTAALAMTLVADEDLDLDEPLTGLPVTLRQLLSHTSGLESNVDEEGARSRWAAKYRRQPDFPPGTVFSYSNVGYVLAGHLAEEVTGMDWAEALTAILGVAAEDPTVSGHSGRIPVEQVMSALEAPNGGLALSASNLVKFLENDINAEMCDEQLDDVEIGPFGLADGWGLGWARFGSCWGHDGTGDGTSAHLRFSGDLAVALTANAGTAPALWADVLAELDFAQPKVERVPVAAPLDRAGVYLNGDAEFVIEAADGQLSMGGVPLTCYEDLTFQIRDNSGTAFGGRFLPGDLLQVTGRLARRRA